MKIRSEEVKAVKESDCHAIYKGTVPENMGLAAMIMDGRSCWKARSRRVKAQKNVKNGFHMAENHR